MSIRSIAVTLGTVALFVACIGACSSSAEDNGGGFVGPNGCSKAPDCSFCQACFDQCLCNSGDAQGCLAQCGGSSGGAGGSAGAPGGGGSPAGGGGPSGGSGGGTPSCTQLSTGSAACDSCLHTTCCSSVDACFADATCSALFDCITTSCANASSSQFSSCVQANCSQHLGGASLYNAIGQCLQGNCAGACG